MHFESEKGARRGRKEPRFVVAGNGYSSYQTHYAEEFFLHDEFNMHVDQTKPLYHLTKIISSVH